LGRTIFTPGHTPYHTSYLVRGDRSAILVTGDTMSRRGAGPEGVILDEPHMDLEAYRKNLGVLQSISAFVVPAHDRPFVQGGCPIGMGKRVKF